MRVKIESCISSIEMTCDQLYPLSKPLSSGLLSEKHGFEEMESEQGTQSTLPLAEHGASPRKAFSATRRVQCRPPE